MSQCQTAAQCLKELARVMEQFGIDNVIDAVNSKYIKSEYKAGYYMSAIDLFRNPELWSFAIAEVEGKPVFIGGILWCVSGALYVNGYSFKASAGMDFDKTVWSFNPPNPKTLMVELWVEDIEQLSKQKVTDMCYSIQRVSTSCRQALEREGVKT